jgi:hypothetical protein
LNPSWFQRPRFTLFGMTKLVPPAREAARAFLAATVAALVADAALQAALTALRLSDAAPAPPWWVAAHLVERSRWVVFAGACWSVATRMRAGSATGGTDVAAPASEVWWQVGCVVLLVPVLWTLAEGIVNAALFTLAGRWNTDGQIFWSMGYYRGLVAAYAPWLISGATLMGWSRHA